MRLETPMVFRRLLGKIVTANLIWTCSIGLATLIILTACGTTPALTTTPTNLSSTAGNGTGLKAGSGLSQPKVVGQGRDANGGKIDFTEPPILNDGVPVFLFFETEN